MLRAYFSMRLAGKCYKRQLVCASVCKDRKWMRRSNILLTPEICQSKKAGTREDSSRGFEFWNLEFCFPNERGEQWDLGTLYYKRDHVQQSILLNFKVETNLGPTLVQMMYDRKRVRLDHYEPIIIDYWYWHYNDCCSIFSCTYRRARLSSLPWNNFHTSQDISWLPLKSKNYGLFDVPIFYLKCTPQTTKIATASQRATSSTSFSIGGCQCNNICWCPPSTPLQPGRRNREKETNSQRKAAAASAGKNLCCRTCHCSNSGEAKSLNFPVPTCFLHLSSLQFAQPWL